MAESFLLAIKWYIISLGVLIGTSAMMISESRDSMTPIIIAILGYGFSYIMTAFWKDFRDKLLFASGAVFVTISLLAPYLPLVLIVFFDFEGDINKYYLWGASMAVIGIPVMTIVFKFMNT